ncbi:unnamed protein product [Rotaria sordida]|uniref:Uncharacterized protein n=1 Tax=Rotaria sordida TaxID=392033 RepID=A0A818M0L8_9BILA|nr:unnamed protein product [Rotaria sordida]
MQMAQMCCLGLQKTSIYVRPLIATIIIGWLLARFFDAFYWRYQIDMLTIYFLIWQFMFVIVKWESEEVPIFSFGVHRVWLCMSVAFGAFITHNTVFRYVSPKIKLSCLHPQMLRYNSDSIKKLSEKNLSDLHNIYYTWDIDDDKFDEKDILICLGIGDFYVFNLMLLNILSPLSSMTINMCITIGYIIAVQIGQEGTARIGYFCNQSKQPALPLPIVSVLIYSFLLSIFIE